MSLVLLNLQSNQRIKLETDNPLIIGRGNVQKCYDKRVSRNHGRITCTVDGKIHIVALHVNPCYFTRNGVPPVLSLNKNEQEVLNKGDCLGLLPNAFWFQIVSENEINSVVKDNSDYLCKNLTTPGNSILNSQPLAVSLNSPTGFKKCELENTRRLPLWMYDIDELNESNKSSKKHGIQSNEGLDTKRAKLSLDNPVKKESENSIIKVKNDGISNLPTTSKNVSNSQSEDSRIVLDNLTETKEEGSSDKISNDANVGNEQDRPERRPYCQYDSDCYRKSLQHKLDFCHPGDADYKPYEKRPLCQYGEFCYRRNEQHRREQRHPSPTVQATTISSNSSGSCSSAVSSPLPAKRQRKKVIRKNSSYEDQDDYDSDDPFVTDASSDEYLPSGSDSEGEGFISG